MRKIFFVLYVLLACPFTASADPLRQDNEYYEGPVYGMDGQGRSDMEQKVADAILSAREEIRKSVSAMEISKYSGNMDYDDVQKIHSSIAEMYKDLNSILYAVEAPRRRLGSNPSNMYKLRDLNLLKNKGDISAAAFDGL